eukprot:Pgem_evm1s1052
MGYATGIKECCAKKGFTQCRRPDVDSEDRYYANPNDPFFDSEYPDLNMTDCEWFGGDEIHRG